MKNWGIRGKVLFLALAPAALIAAALALHFVNSRITDLEQSLRERGLAIARQLAPASEYGVFAGNPPLLGIQAIALIAVAPRPPKRKAPIYDAPQLAKAEATEVLEPEVVTLSTSGGRHYGVMVGQFSSNGEADRFLTKTVLAEGPTLGNGLRKVVRGNRGYDATVLGLTQREAELACSRLQSKGIGCFTIGE